jgi:hypothetical protein
LSCDLQNILPTIRYIFDLTKHSSPTPEVLSDRYRHYILECQCSSEAQRRDERATLIRLQVSAQGFQLINQSGKKPFRHPVRIIEPLLKIWFVLGDYLIMEPAHPKHANSPILLNKENLTSLRE